MKTSIGRSSSKGLWGEKEEENAALASKGPSQGYGKKNKKKDLSKVKCLMCGEFGHYNTRCPQRKKEN